MNETTQDAAYVEKLRDAFDTMAVYKDLKKNNFISSFKLPSFMRDWILGRFQDEDGEIDVDETSDFIQRLIPKKKDWKNILNRISVEGEQVQCLTKVSVNIDIKTNKVSFALPDFGLPYSDTIILEDAWEKYSKELLKNEESWGIVKLGYLPPEGKEKGKVTLEGYQDFCPYTIDLDEFTSAREDFTIEEWVDILLGAVDYNAAGY